MASSESKDYSEYQSKDAVYQPEFKGALISHLRPTSEIEEEYREGHDSYQTKTAAIAKTFDQWRSVRGDGSCGYRAAVFGYFESLTEINDAKLIKDEESRWNAHNAVIHRHVGETDYYYEDCVQPLFDFLFSLHTKPEAQRKEALNAKFNIEDQESQSIIWHMRAWTAAYMRQNPDNYSAFLVDENITSHTDSMLVVDSEIDHVDFTVLIDSLFLPAGLGVEILSLNTYSDKEDLDVVRHFPQDKDPIRIVRTLYRPGHYDLIYKSTPSETASNTPATEVHATKS